MAKKTGLKRAVIMNFRTIPIAKEALHVLRIAMSQELNMDLSLAETFEILVKDALDVRSLNIGQFPDLRNRARKETSDVI